MHAFDGRTYGQTDTFLIVSPRWHSMQRGKTRKRGNCECILQLEAAQLLQSFPALLRRHNDRERRVTCCARL